MVNNKEKEINLNIPDLDEAELMMLVLLKGYINYIKTGKISFKKTSQVINPRLAGSLRDANAHKYVIEMIERFCQLENIKKILPDKYDEKINKYEELIDEIVCKKNKNDGLIIELKQHKQYKKTESKRFIIDDPRR